WRCAVPSSGPKSEPRLLARAGRPFRNRRSGGGERLSLPLLDALPFQLGNFLDQLLHPPIIADGPANTLLPCFGDADLTRLPSVTLDQVYGLMQFALGTMAARFTAL